MVEETPVTEPDPVERILAALGGKYAVRILTAADSPMSAQELSDALEVPIATCYRRIEELEDAGLLVCEGRETSDRGRRTKVYRRAVDGASLDVAGDAPRLDLDEREEGSDRRR